MKKLLFLILIMSGLTYAQNASFDTLKVIQLKSKTASRNIGVKDSLFLTVKLDSTYIARLPYHTQALATVIGVVDSLNAHRLYMGVDRDSITSHNTRINAAIQRGQDTSDTKKRKDDSTGTSGYARNWNTPGLNLANSFSLRNTFTNGITLGDTLFSTAPISIGTNTMTSGGMFANTSNVLLLSLNSTGVSGGYLRLQKSGIDEFYIGRGTAVSGVAGYYNFYNADSSGQRFYTNGLPAFSLEADQTFAFTLGGTVGGLLSTGGLTVTANANHNIALDDTITSTVGLLSGNWHVGGALTLNNTALVNITNSGGVGFAINSTQANGGYIVLRESTADKFYIGKSNAVGGGSGKYDIYAVSDAIRIWTNGSLALTLATDQSATFASTVTTTKVIQDSMAYGGSYIEQTNPDSIIISSASQYYTIGAKQGANGYPLTSDGILKNITVQDSSLTINSTGVYRTSYKIDGRTLNIATAAELHAHLFVNDVLQPQGGADGQVSASNAHFKLTSTTHISVTAAGTIIKTKIQSPDDADGTLIIHHATMLLERIE